MPPAVMAVAAVVSAAAATYGAVQSSKQAKEMKSNNAKTEEAARKAQAGTAAIAQKEKEASDKALQEGQQRILKTTSGRTGLLFGSELGTQDTAKTTLGV